MSADPLTTLKAAALTGDAVAIWTGDDIDPDHGGLVVGFQTREEIYGDAVDVRIEDPQTRTIEWVPVDAINEVEIETP